MRLNDAIRAQRIKRGLSQQRLADLAGMRVKSLERIEAGTHPDMRIKTVGRLAAALGITSADLLKDVEIEGGQHV